jgi:hypothetical protein
MAKMKMSEHAQSSWFKNINKYSGTIVTIHITNACFTMLPVCVTLGKLLNFLMSQFSHAVQFSKIRWYDLYEKEWICRKGLKCQARSKYLKMLVASGDYYFAKILRGDY